MPSLHNCLFFKACRNALESSRITQHGNASNIISDVNDNDYNTYSELTDFAVDISDGSSPTKVDAVFIICSGVTQHSGTPSGGTGSGWSNEAVPTNVQNFNGVDTAITVNGLQRHLVLFENAFTATSVRIQFSGASLKVYEILLLEFGFELNANKADFSELTPTKVDRTGVLNSTVLGRVSRSAPIGRERHKWEVNCRVNVVPGRSEFMESVDEILAWQEENPNFVFAQEYSRYPARVYPASFATLKVPTGMRSASGYKGAGERISFQIVEQ